MTGLRDWQIVCRAALAEEIDSGVPAPQRVEPPESGAPAPGPPAPAPLENRPPLLEDRQPPPVLADRPPPPPVLADRPLPPVLENRPPPPVLADRPPPPLADRPPPRPRPPDISGLGRVVPILAGSPGAGASVTAAVLVDALAAAGHQVLLVDAADPARSGLAAATPAEGPWFRPVGPGLGVRYSWRSDVVTVARLESAGPAVISPEMVPPPAAWLSGRERADVTVVDLGHDGWRATAHPLSGAGAWLRRSVHGDPEPLLVVRATRPSLLHAEQVLARLDRWVAEGVVCPPVQLVIAGARRWPAGTTGAAGMRLAGLLDRAVFLPRDRTVELAGVTPAPMPDRLINAVTRLLVDRGLVAPRPRLLSPKGTS